jgi:hypothetical protein
MTQAPTKDQEATQAKTPQQLRQKAMKGIDMKVIAGLKLLLASSSMCVALIGCGGGGSDVAPAPMSAMSQCGQLTNGFGPAFFCGTKQANLWVNEFQDGNTGYCMFADQNLSIVGYSAITNNGGAFLVTSQDNARTQCASLSNNPFPYNCTTYLQCNRICAAGVLNCTSR